jgi:hypothetical protein
VTSHRAAQMVNIPGGLIARHDGQPASSIALGRKESFRAYGSKDRSGRFCCFSCEKADRISPARLLR